METLYKKYTGEEINLSEQYFIDCGVDGDGCAGGAANEGFKVTRARQYAMTTAKFPYYGTCEYDMSA